ncbi:MAG: ORF6N domain-containing protein [Bacteroidales bacterium]
MSAILKQDNIGKRIFTIRGLQVMLDSDLADLYGVETKVFNQAVTRNIERFPNEFRFQLTNEEWINLRSQIVTSSLHGGRRYAPYVFTEQGVSMLSAVLRSQTAINVSIAIMNAFVEMRKFIATNAALFQRLDNVEKKQIEADKNFDRLFAALESKNHQPKQGIFFNGEVYDAYTLVSDIIRSAHKSLILIDNYIDDTVLTLFTKRADNVRATIYTKNISKQLKLDLEKHNTQYSEIKLKVFMNAHELIC